MIGIFLDLREILRIPAPAVGQRGGGGDIVGIGLEEDGAVLRDGVERRASGKARRRQLLDSYEGIRDATGLPDPATLIREDRETR